MNRPNIVLLLLLLVQLAALGYQHGAGPGGTDTPTSPHLVRTDGYVVDELRLEDPEGHVALLQRGDHGWILPGLKGLPADSERVGKLLEVLTDTDPGWPVAHSGAARQRFQVASYLFRLKLTLSAQQRELGSVYLGTSPGFRKVHARSAGEDPIYSVPLELFKLPAEEGGWLDPALLQVRAPLRITSDGYSLDRSSGRWLLGEGGEPDPRELKALLDALKTLRLEGVANQEQVADVKQHEADMILQVVSLRGEITLKFYKLGDAHYVRSSAFPFLFKLSGYDFDKLSGIDGMLLSGAGETAH